VLLILLTKKGQKLTKPKRYKALNVKKYTWK